MPTSFVGRTSELAALEKRLDRVARSGAGVAVAVRGRRQVGKSRLVQEFCDQSGVPYVYVTAVKGAGPVEAVAAFCADLRDSTLPADPAHVPVLDTGDWLDAFRLLASALPDRPAIVVIDELPWLAEQDERFDGALQVAWDRLWRERPVLLLVLGSDLHMMERLTAYDRPFFGRADNMVLNPLDPAETGDALGLAGADAVDAHLVSGGLPGILAAWPHGTPALDYISQECDDAASPLFSVPESTLLSEFPRPDQIRRVLEAVGSGDRTRANIAATASGRGGPVPSGSLAPLLRLLVEDKRVLAVDHPLSVKPGRPALYRVADSNLRLYLAMLRRVQELARRGRPHEARQLVGRRFPTWRGRAVEPLVRESMELALAGGESPWPDAEAVGGWWNRQFDPEIDLIGADRRPVARRIFFAGSIKWLGSPFDDHDFAALADGAAAVPGARPGETALVAVSHAGYRLERGRLDLAWRPADVVSAFRRDG
jgi:uncharacterized protein